LSGSSVDLRDQTNGGGGTALRMVLHAAHPCCLLLKHVVLNSCCMCEDSGGRVGCLSANVFRGFGSVPLCICRSCQWQQWQRRKITTEIGFDGGGNAVNPTMSSHNVAPNMSGDIEPLKS
jgi:hypothetical protein